MIDILEQMPERKSTTRRNAISRKPPVCVGSGFVALDLVFVGNDRRRPSFTFAGGSCGNVLTILAYLGWDSVPVIRLKNDREARRLIADLEKWSVDTTFVRRERSGTTPVVVQRICTAINGDAYHRFEWKCPTNGTWLPRYTPLPRHLAVEVSTRLPKPRVFFFDRVARSALFLAQQAKAQGALIFFEPSGLGDLGLFAQCVAVADIVKYSAERLESLPRVRTKDRPRLEIQTLGKHGLRYAIRDNPNYSTCWRKLAAVPTDEFKDAVGAGDWCSAGILDILGRTGRRGFLRASEARIVEAVRHGQSLASVNCRYAGARGGMYLLTKASLENIASTLLTAAT
ncbi:MAG: fructokinase [Acidobacteriota bacterium]|jgi:fructokinase|nr:fructokinase [Acidobacteriota bacterium]